VKWPRAAVIAALLLAGCASTPPQIANPPAQPLSVSEATGHLAEHLHQPVRWGGIILSVTPQPEEIWIEIEARPLGHWGTRTKMPLRWAVSMPDCQPPAWIPICAAGGSSRSMAC